MSMASQHASTLHPRQGPGRRRGRRCSRLPCVAVCLATALAVGCLGDGPSALQDGGTEGGADPSMDSGTPWLPGGPDAGAGTPGAAGASCRGVCDCQLGLDCREGRCTAQTQGVSLPYCCAAVPCPGGERCQTLEGTLSLCGWSPPSSQPPPQACDGGLDCLGACPPVGLGCVCVPSPVGGVCLPSCREDADCAGLGPRAACRAGVCES